MLNLVVRKETARLRRLNAFRPLSSCRLWPLPSTSLPIHCSCTVTWRCTVWAIDSVVKWTSNKHNAILRCSLPYPATKGIPACSSSCVQNQGYVDAITQLPQRQRERAVHKTNNNLIMYFSYPILFLSLKFMWWFYILVICLQAPLLYTSSKSYDAIYTVDGSSVFNNVGKMASY